MLITSESTATRKLARVSGVMHKGGNMTDWQEFCEAIPWFLNHDAKVKVSEESSQLTFSINIENQLPLLTQLLKRATVTGITIENVNYNLLAWDSLDSHRLGWLSLAPNAETADIEIIPLHKELLASFGGVIERFNESDDTWLLNTNEFLTAKKASNDATFIEDYLWAFEDEGIEIPIVLENFYCVLREANGNTTLCHKKTGQILFFATDHSFDHITPVQGCPEYTLYDIAGSENFITWVESIAQQWLNKIA